MIGIGGQLAVAAGAGALLNLTPCVLPVIPIKIRTIIHHAGASWPQRFVAAVAFTSGTLLFFLILGLLSAALHWTWGTLFQSRVILALLVGVLTGSGIMVYADIGLPTPRIIHRIGGGRFFEPFSSGALAAALATPCTGPFLGGVLTFSLTQPSIVIVALFVAIGLGLAFPYVILLLKPDLLKRLPRGGAWSRRAHQSLAFVLLAGAVFFAQSLLPPPLGVWLWRLWAALLVVWTIWVAFGKSRAARMVAAGFTIGAIGTAYAGNLFTHASPGPLGWQPLSAARLAAARREGRPVLIEFTAAWCINCKILERTVYAEPVVARVAHRANILPLQADLTTPNQGFEKRMVAYGGAGLPFAVVLTGRGTVIRRFSGLFTSAALIDAFNAARNDHVKSGHV